MTKLKNNPANQDPIRPLATLTARPSTSYMSKTDYLRLLHYHTYRYAASKEKWQWFMQGRSKRKWNPVFASCFSFFFTARAWDHEQVPEVELHHAPSVLHVYANRISLSAGEGGPPKVVSNRRPCFS